MESIDKLREWVNGLRGAWLDTKDNSIIFTTGDDVPPSMVSVNLRDHFNGILDGIEQEVEDERKARDGQSWLRGYAECRAELMEGNEFVTASLEEAGWVKLPRDADGVPIRVGESIYLTKDQHFACVDKGEYAVHGIGDGIVFIDVGTTTRIAVYAHECRHYTPPTVEDVLREFADEVQRCCDTEDTIAEYAAKLRLAEGSE